MNTAGQLGQSGLLEFICIDLHASRRCLENADCLLDVLHTTVEIETEKGAERFCSKSETHNETTKWKERGVVSMAKDLKPLEWMLMQEEEFEAGG